MAAQRKEGPNPFCPLLGMKLFHVGNNGSLDLFATKADDEALSPRLNDMDGIKKFWSEAVRIEGGLGVMGLSHDHIPCSLP